MYKVSCSRRVLDKLKELILRNPTHASSISSAAIEIDRRLHVYPQFGQPLRNLAVKQAQLWIATLPPLSLQYLLLDYDDERRAEKTGLHGVVLVMRPFTPLPHSGIV
jgi:hypothetical protein